MPYCTRLTHGASLLAARDNYTCDVCGCMCATAKDHFVHMCVNHDRRFCSACGSVYVCGVTSDTHRCGDESGTNGVGSSKVQYPGTKLELLTPGDLRSKLIKQESNSSDEGETHSDFLDRSTRNMDIADFRNSLENMIVKEEKDGNTTTLPNRRLSLRRDATEKHRSSLHATKELRIGLENLRHCLVYDIHPDVRTRHFAPRECKTGPEYDVIFVSDDSDNDNNDDDDEDDCEIVEVMKRRACHDNGQDLLFDLRNVKVEKE